jgi:hypothetical protein
MSHVPHDLPEMLGIDTAEIHRLGEADPHFARQCEQYRELNREIHRCETDVQPTSEDALHEMKKRRLALLDEIRAAMPAS